MKNPPEKVCGAYTLSLKLWDISLTLNMTYFFIFFMRSQNLNSSLYSFESFNAASNGFPLLEVNLSLSVSPLIITFSACFFVIGQPKMFKFILKSQFSLSSQL